MSSKWLNYAPSVLKLLVSLVFVTGKKIQPIQFKIFLRGNLTKILWLGQSVNFHYWKGFFYCFYFNIKTRAELQRVRVCLGSRIKNCRWDWGDFHHCGNGFPQVFLMLPRWGHPCPPGKPAARPLCFHAWGGRQAWSADWDCWMLKGCINCPSHSTAPIIAGCWVHCQLEWQRRRAAAVTDGWAPATLWQWDQSQLKSFLPS